MANGLTVYFTYMFDYDGGESFSPSKSYGYGNSIHCGYIQSVEVTSMYNKNLTFYFKNADEFRFMSNYSELSQGLGWNANKLYGIYQIIENDSSGVKANPISTNWKIIDVTNQIPNYDPQYPIDRDSLVNTPFVVSLEQYNNADTYNLDYISYPTTSLNDQTSLCFGDEMVFLGNVITDAEARFHTFEFVIDMPASDYNTTNNLTWDGESSVLISEVCIYDNDNNLVGIGKFSNPIIKNSNISRNIVFSIDF